MGQNKVSILVRRPMQKLFFGTKKWCPYWRGVFISAMSLEEAPLPHITTAMLNLYHTSLSPSVLSSLGFRRSSLSTCRSCRPLSTVCVGRVDWALGLEEEEPRGGRTGHICKWLSPSSSVVVSPVAVFTSATWGLFLNLGWVHVTSLFCLRGSILLCIYRYCM